MQTQADWYLKTPRAIFDELGVGEAGLSNKEAESRIEKYGRNILPEPKTKGLIAIFFSQFASPLIYILMAAAAVVFYMGETADAVIIMLVLVFNAVIGAVQEGKAQNTLNALKRFIETSAAVRRDGTVLIKRDKDLVPGDIIILQEGDKIPADARIISENSLLVNEASLTGESEPVAKNAETMVAGAGSDSVPVSDRLNMLYRGTNIVSGNGIAVVVATGVLTEIGKISVEVSSIDSEVPLKKSIRLLSRAILAAVFIISTLIMSFGLAAGNSFKEMFATVVSLAVSIIPEGLPIVMTLVLASGVWRMTKRGVLVKKLQAVEALGQARIIAVDKTGTLTRNEMVIETVYSGGKMFSIQGKGYEPKGEIFLEGDSVPVEPLNHEELIMAGRAAYFCDDAHAVYIEASDQWKVSGDPTEAALEAFSRKVGFKEDMSESPRIFEIPFHYVEKYHLSINKYNNKNFMTVVGAPEKVLQLSGEIWSAEGARKISADDKIKLQEVFSGMSARGLRVLAFAINNDSPAAAEIGKLPPLVFGGFFGLNDPVRKEAKQAIKDAHDAGIRVVMITGDHEATARAIAKDAGLAGHAGVVITGEHLESLSDLELTDKMATCNIFARVTPQHKLRIIELFRKRGEIVAMTGDGVNDAPSLAAADLGVAMGKIGTEVAKEAADLVLLDDNFGSIIAAVEEGRAIYKTIKKVMLYLFSTSIGELLVIVGSIFLGLPLPLVPVQIIWLNFVTDGFLDVSLAMEHKEEGLLKERARKIPKYILDADAVRRMVMMGFVIAVGTLFVFITYLNGDSGKALTMSLTTLAIFQWFNAWNCKSENKSLFSAGSFRNVFLILATVVVVLLQLLAVYNPIMQHYLHTVPLSLADWAYAFSVASSIVVVEEIRKLFYRSRKAKVS